VIFRCRESRPRSSARVRHDNLRDVDADVPLWRTVAVAGVSGSGNTSPAIGNTIRTHVSHLYAKLGAHSRTEAVEPARTPGLLAPHARR
jgi:excinuclease ABC subunit A